jgi:L-amino acid N-acyltransferase YncA
MGGMVQGMNARFPSGRIRRASLAHVPVLAALNVRTWRETYRGLLPEALLDGDEALVEWQQTWQTVLQYAGPLDVVFLLEDPAGQAVGYASAGPARESAMGYGAEVYTLYLLKEAQGRGWGRELWQALLDHWEGRPFYLWSHAANPVSGFYGHLGGRKIATRQGRWGEVTYPEWAWGFGRPGVQGRSEAVEADRGETADL